MAHGDVATSDTTTHASLKEKTLFAKIYSNHSPVRFKRATNPVTNLGSVLMLIGIERRYAKKGG